MTLNVRTKLILFTFSLVFLVGGSIALYTVFQGRQQILSTFDDDSRRIAVQLAGFVANDVYYLDIRSLRHRLENTRLNPDINYTYVTDLDGVVLADATAENTLRDQRLTDPFTREILRADRWISRTEGTLLKVGGPILMPDGQRIGHFQVGFSLQGPFQLVEDTTRATLYLTIICLGIGVVLAIMVGASFTRPLQSLIRATEQIGAGKLDTRLSVKRQDEFGILAESVNQMAESLQKRHEETKRAGEALRESQNRLRVLLETTRAIPWEADAKTWRFTYIGPQAVKLLGYPLDRWREDDFWPSHIHPDDREYAVEFCLKSSRALKDYDFEYRMITADGQAVWIHDVVSVVSVNGAPETLRGFMVDITERKRSVETLEQERAFLRQVIDVDPNLIFAKDRDGRFTLANQAVADIYGTTVEELIGKTDADFDSNLEEVEFFRKMDLEVMDTLQERLILEEHITDAQGKVRWLQTVKRPIVGKDGAANQVLGASTDITKRKETESELRHQREELAHVTRISTMGELAASLAHELNQPLTAILSNAQAAQRFLAAKPADLGEIKDILKDIVEDNSRAGEIIRRMRALVKKEDLSFESLDLGSVLRDIVQLVHSDAILRNVRISVETNSKLPFVRGDKVQLQQVVLNLLLNAFDAMRECPADERQVLVRVDCDGVGRVEVSVRDRGTGLTSDMLDKIFQPFFTTKRDGLGMGLSISRSIVEAHGGRLWAENNSDRGATFHMVLAAFAEAEQTPENSA